MSQTEYVVLLDDEGRDIGRALKSEVHSTDTALHLAFSCHIVDGEGRVLVTRRALDKKTWPGVWTNSFCGHPGPGESIADAVHRRAAHELGTDVTEVSLALPDFRYRATDASGIVENEICPVYTARASTPLDPNPSEVVDTRWVDPVDLGAAIRATPWAFSPWLVLQAAELPLFGAPLESRRAS